MKLSVEPLPDGSSGVVLDDRVLDADETVAIRAADLVELVTRAAIAGARSAPSATVTEPIRDASGRILRTTTRPLTAFEGV